VSAITAAFLAAGVSSAPALPRDREMSPLHDTGFVLPGAYYVQEVGTPAMRDTSNGAGLEASVVRHFGGAGEWVAGGVLQGEKVHRWRVAAGAELGYEFVGLELTAARDFASDTTRAQWSMQISPYFSAGFLWVSARWVIALTDRHASDAPGDAAMLLVGFKVPIPFDASGEH
jgi:hypothetical protein